MPSERCCVDQTIFNHFSRREQFESRWPELLGTGLLDTIMEGNGQSLALKYDLYVNNVLKFLDTTVERGKCDVFMERKGQMNTIKMYS